MRPTTLSILLIPALLCGCSSAGPGVNNQRDTAVVKNTPAVATDTISSPVADYAVLYDSIVKTMCGASLADTVKNITPLFFSSKEHPDTFELRVFPGPLATSLSVFTIKATDNRLLYCDTFHTHSLIKYIFEPDTTPHDGGQAAYDNYMRSYVSSITRQQYEDYLHKQVTTFFESIFVRADEIRHIADDITVQDDPLYKKAMKDTSVKIFYLNDYEQDEGGHYFVYSAAEKTAVSIVSAD